MIPFSGAWFLFERTVTEDGHLIVKMERPMLPRSRRLVSLYATLPPPGDASFIVGVAHASQRGAAARRRRRLCAAAAHRESPCASTRSGSDSCRGASARSVRVRG